LTIGHTQIPGFTRWGGGLSHRGGVSIPCQPVTSGVTLFLNQEHETIYCQNQEHETIYCQNQEHETIYCQNQEHETIYCQNQEHETIYCQNQEHETIYYQNQEHEIRDHPDDIGIT
jgi:hypothetical protein